MPPIKLSLNRGVPQVRNDNRSFERYENDSLSLVNIGGISAIDWTPQVAQIKGNAVYADTPMSDGRVPLALPYGDVTETINISLTGVSAEGLAYLLKRLRKMAEDAHAYWTTNWQIQPIILEWEWALNKPQFAIVKKIDVAHRINAFEGLAMNVEATIIIERGYAWHGISNGDNPKRWTYIHNANPTGFTSSTCSLIDNSNHLAGSSTLVNRLVWSTANNPYRTESNVNFLSISASQVPGDIPALLQILIQPERATTPLAYRQIFIWKSTRDLTITDRNNNLYSVGYNLNSDANRSGAAASSFSSLNTETTFTNKVVWSGSPAIPSTTIWLDKTVMRGQYMIFARMYAGAGAVGDVRARLVIADQGSSTSNTTITGAEVRVRLTDSLHYMGMFSIPFAERAEMSPFGDGLFITSAPTAGTGNQPYNIAFTMQFRNVIGTTRTINFWDLVLIPIDEGACVLQAPAYTPSGTLTQFLVDGTGHLDRGKGQTVAKMITGNADVTVGGSQPEDYGGEPVEVRGELPTLQPNIDQRLYIMLNDPASECPWDDGVDTFRAYINIVPRWLGLRDV